MFLVKNMTNFFLSNDLLTQILPFKVNK